MSSGRSNGARGWLSPRQVIDFAEAVRAQLRLDPAQTLEQLIHATGAPQDLVIRVRRRWLDAPREDTHAA